MTKSAALEYANDNIRVNAVCPGYTKSALLDQLLKMRDDMDKLLLRFVPMRRFGEAKEIAENIHTVQVVEITEIDDEKEECPAHKCKPFMLMSYVAVVFLILGICAFSKYLFF